MSYAGQYEEHGEADYQRLRSENARLRAGLEEAQAKITAARTELLNDGPDHTAGHSECTSCRVFAILEGESR